MSNVKASTGTVTAGHRASAEGILKHLAEQHEKRLRAVNLLRTVIPWDKLTEQEEELLWSYFVSRQ